MAFLVRNKYLEDGAVSTTKIQTGAVTSTTIAASAVTSAAIAPNAVTNTAIDTGAVTSTAIAANAVTSTAIAAGAVTSAALAANSVTSTAIASGAVTSTALAAGAVDATSIAAGSVGSTALAPNAVTSTAIATDAVTTTAVLDGAITASKLAAGVAGLNQLTGDVTAGPGGGSQAATVVGLQTKPIAATPPILGQYLGYDGTSWTPSLPSFAGPASGDLGGNYPSPTVVAIQTRPVAATVPTDGQSLVWDGGLSTWKPGLQAASGTASGDLSGSYPSPTVAKIQGRTVASTAPTNGQTLVYDSLGSQWAPGTTTASGAASGDLSGTYPAPTVAKIQGTAVASTAPTNGQALVYSSLTSQWVPSAVAPTGAASGDLTGNYPSPTVAKLLGRSLNTTAPTANQAYVYDGAQWNATGVAKSGNWSLTGITGASDGLPIFNALGSATVLAPPTSKTNAVLGWLSDGTMGWVGMVAAVLLFAGVTYVSDQWFIDANELVVNLDTGLGMFTASPAGYFDTATGVV